MWISYLSTSKTLARIPIFLSFFLLFSTITSDDSIAILELAKHLNPTPTGWSTNNSTNYCSWPGITCDPSNHVTIISLCGRNLSGTLPSELSTLSKLQYLNLKSNRLSGPIPSLANLSDLLDVSLASNNFTRIPQGFFQGLTALQFFIIDENLNLAPWSMPTDLSQCTSLITFNARKTNLEGNLPEIFASLSSLQHLILSFNNLRGVLPASFRNSGIQILKLNSQKKKLSGNISVLSSMTRLQKVRLHENKFTGPIPDLSECDILYELQLRDNHLTGIVPASLISHPNLRCLSISNNKLQGPIPVFPKKIKVENKGNNNFCSRKAGDTCDPQVTIMLEIAGALGYPMNLSDSWRGNDACKNWSFVTCDEFNRIISVNLGKHNFVGRISSAFADLKVLRSLYLDDNNLTDPIPDSLTNLTELQVLDVSNNNLTGTIPDFASWVKLIATPGNPLLKYRIYNLNTSRTISPLEIVIPLIVIVLCIAFFLFNYIMKKKYRESGRVKDEEKKGNVSDKNEKGCFRNPKDVLAEIKSRDNHKDGNVVITIEVLRQVTDNFCESNILGRGGFGVVYKGELHDKTKIAVKRMETSAISTKGMNEFQAEIEVLTKVRHRHLVDLLGYCINGNEGFLVYEYMPQGTLAQHLFEWNEHGYLPLTWQQRISIALDVARGVEYLHRLAQQSFVHRDLKPSNILLGDDMRAKVGDFGLVKHVPNENYSFETKVAGTFGYLAPEYAVTGRVTTKVDVYAFGVILMEMITGRKAIDYTMEDKGWMFMHLVTWFHSFIIKKEIPKAIIDETLNLEEENTLLSICKVAELAKHCTNPEKCQRPDIGHVVSFLAPLVEDWKPASQKQQQTSGIKINLFCSSINFNSKSGFQTQSSGSNVFVTPRESPIISN